jgi:bifunctional non-homologous end joining protein LigD
MPSPGPMLAKERKEPFDDPEWTFEVKLDGIRVIAELENGKARLWSRNNIEITHKFPKIVGSLSAVPRKKTVVDGEVIAFDKDGRPSFDRLLERYGITSGVSIANADRVNPVELHIFDALFVDGKDVRKIPLKERRSLLKQISIFKGPVKLVETFPSDGELVYKRARDFGFEGIMAKRLDSPYLSGVRSPDWLKIKALHTEEFVIGGYTGGSGARASHFGALLLGKMENGKLHYVGTSGGGFTSKMLDEILALLRPIEIKENPFVDKVTADGPHHWVTPKYWAEVSFTAWTKAGRIRLPRFQRMRLDLTGVSPEQKKGGENKLPRFAEKPDVKPSKTDLLSPLAAQLLGSGDTATLRLQGHDIKFNTLSDVLFPAGYKTPAITKRDLILYLLAVQEWLLPHLVDRPLTWIRFSKGITGDREVHKHWHYKIPDFVQLTKIWSTQSQKATEYVLVNNLPTLLWLAQIETIEFHPWYSRVKRDRNMRNAGLDFASSENALISSVLNYPDFIVFDLDPYIYSGKEKEGDEPELNVSGLEATKEAAWALKHLLESLGIRSYLKSSGKTGLHIYVPIARNLAFEQTRSLAQSIGLEMIRRNPKLITMEWPVQDRKGFVFFDHLQNTRGKTLISLYSPRAVQGGRVAWPVDWNELENFTPIDFNMQTCPALLRKHGDSWSSILSDRQDLQALFKSSFVPR